MPDQVQIDIPSFYTYTVEELLALWQEQTNYDDGFDISNPEQAFRDVMIVHLNYLKWSIEHYFAEYTSAELPPVEAYFVSTTFENLSTLELAQIYDEIYQHYYNRRGNDLLPYAQDIELSFNWEEQHEYVEAYRYLNARITGSPLPFTPYFDPEQTRRNILRYQFGADEVVPGIDTIDEQLRYGFLVHAAQLLIEADILGDGNISAEMRNELVEALADSLGDDYTAENAAMFANDIAYALRSIAASPEGDQFRDPSSIIRNSDELLQLSTNYLIAAEIDDLRLMLFEWQPGRERVLLDDLRAEVGKIPLDVAGISTVEVRNAFLGFHNFMSQRYELLSDLQLQIREDEALWAGLAEQTERGLEEAQSLFTYSVEIILATAWEPFDWIFTTRDILQGRISPSALVALGLLPFVPGSLARAGRIVRQLPNGARSLSRAARNIPDIFGTFRRANQSFDQMLEEWADALLRRQWRYAPEGGYWNNADNLIHRSTINPIGNFGNSGITVGREGRLNFPINELFAGTGTPISLDPSIRIVTRDGTAMSMEEAARISEEIFGQTLTPYQLGALSGGYFAEEIEIQVFDRAMLINVKDSRLVDPTGGYTVFIFRDGDRVVMDNWTRFFQETERRQGLATRSMTIQTEAALRLGIDEMTLAAKRIERDGITDTGSGYNVWWKFGFDINLTDNHEAVRILQDLQLRPDISLPNPNRIMLSDIVATPEGRLWWEENGDTLHLSFELSQGSPNISYLQNYLRSRGVQP